MVRRARLTTVLFALNLAAACRSSSQATGSADASQPRYASTADAFGVSFPLGGTPQVQIDPPETVETGYLKGKQITRASYYVAQGDLVFLVEVQRLPADVPIDAPASAQWALGVMRQNAERILEQREFSIRGPRGEDVAAVEVFAELPSGVRAHNTILYHGQRMYAIGAAPASLTDAATYARFRDSFALLERR